MPRKKAESGTKPKVTEKQIETAILQFLSTIRGCKAWKNQTTGIFDPKTKVYRSLKGRYSGKGSADILACIGGHFVAIEVKKPSGSVVSLHQYKFLEEIRNAGGIAFIARSVDDVKRTLFELGIIE